MRSKYFHNFCSITPGSLLLQTVMCIALGSIGVLYYARWSALCMKRMQNATTENACRAHLLSIYDFIHRDINQSEAARCCTYGEKDDHLLCSYGKKDIGWENSSRGCVRVEGAFNQRKKIWTHVDDKIFFHDTVTVSFFIQKPSENDVLVTGSIASGNIVVPIICTPKGCVYG